MNITLIILAVTVIVSLLAFRDSKIMNELIFNPVKTETDGQWYRLLTCGFVHADVPHLAFNMFTLFSFGAVWENLYIGYLSLNTIAYLILYSMAIIVSVLPSLLKNRGRANYFSLGASGAVTAVVFSVILLRPWSTILVFFVPMPSIVYAFLFLGYSHYMSRKNIGNINHEAHLWGGLFGIVYSVIMQPSVIGIFLLEITHPSFQF